jgi:hypothetical protein
MFIETVRVPCVAGTPKARFGFIFFVLQCFYMFLLFWKDWGESLELALIGPWRGSFRVQISFEVGG